MSFEDWKPGTLSRLFAIHDAPAPAVSMPEHHLLLAVLYRAILDYMDEKVPALKREAQTYLESPAVEEMSALWILGHFTPEPARARAKLMEKLRTGTFRPQRVKC